MLNIPISPKQDFLDRVGSAAPIKAVAELIWNGLDACAKVVEVSFKFNGLNGLEEIRIKDDGTGIDEGKVKSYFGDIGESWKRNQNRFNGRTLHGKDGEGRFKAFALGAFVKWVTVYLDVDGGCKKYEITGRANPYSFEYSTPVAVSGCTGTEVVIANIKDRCLGVLTSEKAPVEFARIFAPYLVRNPDTVLRIDGREIVPSDFCHVVYSKTLEVVRRVAGTECQIFLEIIEWNQPVERGISLCDLSGIELHSVDAKLRAKGVNFTIQLKSDYFVGLAKDNRLVLEDMDPDVAGILQIAREDARSYFRERRLEEQASIVAHWKAEEIYPYDEKVDLSPIERAERQVFDIIGVNIEDYLPKFDDADKAQKKFTFKLIAQAITNNPGSLQKIITDVLGLKKEDQDDLADLLGKTDLTNIIRSAKTVANRLDFLTGLENLLFDNESKKALLERDQLHKILQNEAWIFDENFALTASEATLEDVLRLHIEKLGKRCDDDSIVMRENGGRGRVDLMFSLSNRPRVGETDHLIVELKRPSKKIDSEVYTQITSYAYAVAADPRFQKSSTHWKFIAVSDELDDYVRMQAHQKDRPVGQVFVSDDKMIEVWTLTWTEVLHNAKARLEFINKALSYSADRDSSREYLTKKYERFIPKKST